MRGRRPRRADSGQSAYACRRREARDERRPRRLAHSLGMALSRLMDTVRRYNEAIAKGELSMLDPPRCTSRYAAQQIGVAPFYAAPRVAESPRP